MDQKKDIRKIETKFIKKNLDNNNNLLVVGEKGIGKTTIIKKASKEASRKILSIDLMEVKNIKNLFFHLCSKGKIHLFLEKISKNFLTILTIFISFFALIISITFNYNNLIKWLFVLIIFIILLVVFCLPLVINFFLKKNKKTIIHFHEMNFTSDDKNEKKELLKIIWKIKNIYKDHLLIFESDENFDKELKYKFSLEEIHLTTIDKWSLIEDLFDDLKEIIKNDKIKEKILEKLKILTNQNKLFIQKIADRLTYRTFKNIIDNFKNVYIFCKQQINLLDFLFLKFLQLKDSNLYYKIMKNENYNQLIDSSDNEIKKDFLERIKSILPDILFDTNNFPNKNKHFFKNYISKKTKFYSFFNPVYKLLYFSNLNCNYLEIDLIEKFQNKPLIFLKELNEYIKLNEFHFEKIEIFEFIENKKIIEFLNFIEKQNSKKLLSFFLKNDIFLKRNFFRRLNILIINSRKNKKIFFNSLPKKYKYYFFKNYFINSNQNGSNFEEKELKNIEKDLIPFKINDIPKNLILILGKYNDKETFNHQKYCKKIIKDKNKFLALLISQRYDSIIGDFFVLLDFLSNSEKSFFINCFDEFNKNISKTKNLKIRKYNSGEKKSIEVSDEELEEHRNFKK